MSRSCWLELSDLCVTEKIPPPTWQQLDCNVAYSNGKEAVNNEQQHYTKKKENTTKTNGQEYRIMYLCFLAHYYLELQQGEKAMKVLEGVLHIFPLSQIATSQVCSSKKQLF